MDDYLRKVLRRLFGNDVDLEGIEEFEREMRKLEKIMDEADKLSELSKYVKEEETPYGKKRTLGPIVYGISITKIGDEEPRIEEWGNIGTMNLNMIEPYVESIETDDEYRITAELPGVNGDIETKIEDNYLVIKADGNGREYMKKIHLDKPVEEEIEKSYKNGILDIKLKKKTA